MAHMLTLAKSVICQRELIFEKILSVCKSNLAADGDVTEK